MSPVKRPSRKRRVPDGIRRELVKREAVLNGHFLLSSGLHSDQYVQCARLLQDPRYAQELGWKLAALWPKPRPAIIVSPALGGILIGHEVAKAMRVSFLFTERVDAKMTLRRGFAIEPGAAALVVEDVFTTGKSTREVIDLLARLGAKTFGALSIIDRGVDPAVLGVPVRSLVRLPLRTWEAEGCPLCRKGEPVIKPGSRPIG